MDLLVDDSSARVFLATAVLGLLLGLEWWAPFRVPLRPKLRHVATNLGIVRTNGVVVSLLFGGPLLILSRRAVVEMEVLGSAFAPSPPAPSLAAPSSQTADLVLGAAAQARPNTVRGGAGAGERTQH